MYLQLHKGFIRVLCLSLAGVWLVLFARSRGSLAAIDLAFYDRLFPKASVSAPCSDAIAVVQASEDDLKQYGYPLPGTVTSELLATLQTQGVATIGFGLFRDLPQEPGHKRLLQQLAEPNVISIGLERGKDGPIPFPPGATAGGLADLKVDKDGTLRRLPYMMDTASQPSYATAIAAQHLDELPWQDVASRLQQYEIVPYAGPYGDYFQVGHEVLVPWQSCRFRTFSFADILTGGKAIAAGDVVLVGQAAASVKNPFIVSGGRQLYDAEVFANLVALELATMAGRHTPVRFPNNLVVAIGIVTLVVAQSAAVWQVRNRQALVFIGTGVAVAVLLAATGAGLYLGAFTLATYWLPIGSAILAIALNLFITTSAIYVLRLSEHNAYLAQEVERRTEELLQERSQIAAGKMLDGVIDSLHDPVMRALSLATDLKEVLKEGATAVGGEAERDGILRGWAGDAASISNYLLDARERVALVSQLRSGTKRQEVTDVSKLIECIAGMTETYEKKGFTVLCYYPPAGLTAKISPENLARIVLGLVSNSIDALSLERSRRPELQPKLQIDARRADRFCTIEVSDNTSGNGEARLGLTTTIGDLVEVAGGSITGSRILTGGYRHTVNLPVDE
ncbi:MAG: CHASE2 domain-containing protein [Cyanobacteria bacterium J06641_5]